MWVTIAELVFSTVALLPSKRTTTRLAKLLSSTKRSLSEPTTSRDASSATAPVQGSMSPLGSISSSLPWSGCVGSSGFCSSVPSPSLPSPSVPSPSLSEPSFSEPSFSVFSSLPSSSTSVLGSLVGKNEISGEQDATKNRITNRLVREKSLFIIDVCNWWNFVFSSDKYTTFSEKLCNIV